MNLFIKIKDGKPFEHPIIESNFRAAYPQIDVDNLPSEFSRFNRVPAPNTGVYEIYVGVTYEFDGTVVKDVHNVRKMSEEEKVILQSAVKQNWFQHGFASWVFDEESCSFKPPVPRPNDNKHYEWSEEQKNWVEL